MLESGGFFDTDLYDEETAVGKGTKSRYEGYNTSIAANDDDGDEDEEDDGFPVPQKRTTYTAPISVLKDVTQGKEDVDPMAEHRRPTIADREDEYRQKRRRIIISPDRADPFADGGKTPDVGSRTYTDIMREQMLKGEESELRRRIIEKSKEGTLVKSSNGESSSKEGGRKRGRWDQTVSDSFIPAKVSATPSSAATPTWEDVSTHKFTFIQEKPVKFFYFFYRKRLEIIAGMRHPATRAARRRVPHQDWAHASGMQHRRMP